MAFRTLNSMAQGWDTGQEKKRQMQDAIKMMILKSQIDQQMDPMYQLRKKMLEGGGIPGLGGQTQTQPNRQPFGLNQTIQGQMPQTADTSQELQRWENNPNFLLTGKGDPLTENPEYKQKRERELKAQIPTVQQKNDLFSARQQLNNIVGMRNLAEKVPAGYPGMLSIGTSALTRGGLQTNTRQYLKNFNAYAVSLYRALTGDTRLSDADALRRALPLLWHPSEDKKIRKTSFDSIEKALKTRIKMLSSGRGLTPNPLDPNGNEFITPFDMVLSEAGIDINSIHSTENNIDSDMDKQVNDFLDQLEGQ